MGEGLGGAIDSAGVAQDSSEDLSPERNMQMMARAAQNLTIKMFVREDKVAFETELLGGLVRLRSIIDRASRTLTMLTPDKRAIVTDLKQVDTAKYLKDTLAEQADRIDSLRQTLPKPTGKMETINGLETEIYEGAMAGRRPGEALDVTMWITTDPRMQFYEVIRDAFLGKRRTGMGGLEEFFDLLTPITGKGKIPLKIVATDKGKPYMTSEITEISEESVPDSKFEIPKGYTVVKTEPVQ